MTVHGEGASSVGKASLLEERKLHGRSAFGSLLVKENKKVRVVHQIKVNLKNQKIYHSSPAINERNYTFLNQQKRVLLN